MNSVGRLLSRHLQNLAPGKLEWIGLRPERKAPMQQLDNVQAIESLGLEGDRRCKGSPGSARQVTLISLEHIAVIASLMQREVPPELLRRNLVISGINISALRYQHFRIGNAEFEATAHCHPCVRMEKALGQGAVAAMLGHGGLCAKIVKSGQVSVGDAVIKL